MHAISACLNHCSAEDDDDEDGAVEEGLAAIERLPSSVEFSEDVMPEDVDMVAASGYLPGDDQLAALGSDVESDFEGSEPGNGMEAAGSGNEAASVEDAVLSVVAGHGSEGSGSGSDLMMVAAENPGAAEAATAGGDEEAAECLREDAAIAALFDNGEDRQVEECCDDIPELLQSSAVVGSTGVAMEPSTVPLLIIEDDLQDSMASSSSKAAFTSTPTPVQNDRVALLKQQLAALQSLAFQSKFLVF